MLCKEPMNPGIQLSEVVHDKGGVSWRSWLLVLLIILFFGSIRVRLLNLPLERDEGEYAYVGQLVLQGVPPYQLAYNMKLPGTYLMYAVGMAVFGQNTAGVHWTLIVANSLTIVFVFLLGRRMFNEKAGLVACAGYGLMSVSPCVYGMAAHANHFVVLFAVPAVLLLWEGNERKGGALPFWSGLLFGMALLMKQQAILFILFGIWFLLQQSLKVRPVKTLELWKRAGVFNMGVLLPLSLVCLWLEAAGVFGKFWFWTFTYARSYATSTSYHEGAANLFYYLDEQALVGAGFWGLGILGAVLGWRDAELQERVKFVLGFCFFSFLATAVGLYFRPHYFILFLPALAVLLGVAVIALERQLAGVLKPRASFLISGGLAAAVAVWSMVNQWTPFFRLPPDALCRYIYPDEAFVPCILVGRYLREHCRENEQVAVMGSEPEIYFYSNRRSATGYIYTYALMELHPYALEMQKEMIREIEVARPAFLVEARYGNSWVRRNGSNPHIFDWLQQYCQDAYERVGVVGELNGKVVCRWGDEAKDEAGADGRFLMVYQRKPAMPEIIRH